MKKNQEQIIIIGLGKFGMSMAQEFSKYDCDVMAIDKSEKLVMAVAPYVTTSARVDAIDKDALESLGIRNFDVAIIGMGDDLESSIMVALTLKEFGVPYIIAKSRDNVHTRLLNMIGVDKVVQPEQDSAIRVAKGIMHKHLVKQLEFSKDYSIVEVQASEKWVGKKLNELALRQKHEMNVICIKKNDEEKTIFPSAEYVIEKNDNLMVIAPNKEIEKMSSWM